MLRGNHWEMIGLSFIHSIHLNSLIKVDLHFIIKVLEEYCICQQYKDGLIFSRIKNTNQTCQLKV